MIKHTEKSIQEYVNRQRELLHARNSGIVECIEQVHKAAANAFRQSRDEVAKELRQQANNLERYRRDRWTAVESSVQQAAEEMRKSLKKKMRRSR